MKYHIQEDPVKRDIENINTIINYIQIVLTYMKEQVMHQSLYNVDIIIKTLAVFPIEIVFLFFVSITER